MTHDGSDHDELTRLTTHQLLDLVSVLDDDDAESIPDDSLKLLVRELAEIGAVSALVDDDKPEGERIKVDVAPLLNAVTYLLRVLTGYAARQSDQDRLTVIGTLRASVDQAYGATEDPPTS